MVSSSGLFRDHRNKHACTSGRCQELACDVRLLFQTTDKTTMVLRDISTVLLSHLQCRSVEGNLTIIRAVRVALWPSHRLHSQYARASFQVLNTMGSKILISNVSYMQR